MNSDDAALFQLAKQLVNSGQKRAAYDQLCTIRANGNENDPDLLLWIAFTSPYYQEAQQALDRAALMAPYHPGLPDARAYQRQQGQSYPQQQGQPYQEQRQSQPYQQQQYMPLYASQYVPLVPVLNCPYCHSYAPVLIQNKVSTAGWVVFTVLLITTLVFCWIGLLIKEPYRVCSVCGARLG